MDGQILHNTTNVAGPSIGNSRTIQTQARTQTTQAQTHSPPTPTLGTTLIYRTPSTTVRSNWIYYLRASWRSISRTSKVILGTTLLIGLAQIIITIAILIIGKNELCDKPLDVYLIVFLVRLGFSLPLTLYQYLRPFGFYNRNNLSISETTSQETIPSSLTNPTGTPSSSQNRCSSSTATSDSNSITLPSTSLTSNNLESTLSTNDTISTSSSSPNQINNTASNNQCPWYQPNRMRSSWLDRFKSLLDLISILWFVIGNYMIFTASEQCHHDAKYLFYTTMTWILLGYFLVLIPLFLCVAVVFCLPCLLVAMRVFNVDYATGMVGANKNEIQSIPVYKYKSSSTSEDHHHHHASPTSSSYLSTTSMPPVPSLSNCSSPEKKKRNRMTHFITYHNNDDEESGFEEWTMDPTDASCTICLSDYENGDLICRLRCNHHFHKDCVHEWLSLNYKCPLCQRDFRMNKISSGNDEN